MSTNLTAIPFVDEVEIRVKAGHGGRGIVHFHREKFVPKGGPDGGDGGKGGDVVFEASPHLNTLNIFRSQRIIKADDGEPGFIKCQTGASGADAVVMVPAGTMFYDAETGELLHDLGTVGERYVAAAGGKGGLGNWHFKTARNQAPRKAQPGIEGEERQLRLELRLLADVALIGFPNAGKSSTIRSISRARPKVADYPFTTLTPHLGVVADSDGDGFVVADIPGLIEGASEGAGLGFQFLRHVSRARLLVHVLDLAGGAELESLLQRHNAIVGELQKSPADIEAPIALVTFNKADLVETGDRAGLAEGFTARTGLPVIWTSTATGEGIAELKNVLFRRLKTPASGDTLPEQTQSAADRIWGAA